MSNKEYYSSSGPRVEFRRDAHAESKKVKVTHLDGTTTYEFRDGRPEEHALSSREAYDYHKSSERQERRDKKNRRESSLRLLEDGNVPLHEKKEQQMFSTTGQSAWSERPKQDIIVVGFASQLNKTCLVLFENIINELSKLQNHTVPDIISLKECLCRLYLWGEGFGGGRLDDVLQKSTTLERPVLEFLAAIAVIQLQRLLPLIDKAHQADNILELTKKLTDLVGKAQPMINDGFDASSEDEYDEFDSDDESEAAPKLDDTQRDIAEDINSYVSCLMGLLPSMERVLNFQDKEDMPMYLPGMNDQSSREAYYHKSSERQERRDKKNRSSRR